MWKQSAPGSPVEETTWQGQFKTWRKCLSLKREPKKELGFLVFFFFSLGQPVCHWGASQWARKTLNGKCERSHLSIGPRWCLTHHFSAPHANGFCEQLEVDFPSVSDHSISFSGQGAPTVELSSQETRLSFQGRVLVFIHHLLLVRPLSQPVYDLTLPQS